MAADAHKWLLGPCAAGLLFVRRGVQDSLRPALLGWHNVRSPNYVAQAELKFRSDARRYEAGTQNLLGLAGLSAALDLLTEFGIPAIAAELLRTRAMLVDALADKGLRILNASSPESHASSIVSCWSEREPAEAIQRRLEKGGVIASLRADRTGRQYVRFSPHFYNTDDELKRAIELI
jgi:selenocysteine lyase/cysteine desulfurase